MKTTKVKLFIHIGFPKTGNTTLHYLFLKSKNINYLVRNTTDRRIIEELEIIWESMIFDSLNTYKTKIRKNYKSILSRLSNRKNNVLLIEGITDLFFYYTRKKDFLKRLKILQLETRKKINIQIILTLRKQSEFILSRYLETPEYFIDLKKNWNNLGNLLLSFKKPFARKNKNEKKFVNHLNYSKTCMKLIKYFDVNNTHIYFYEELKYDKINFSKKLSKLLDLNYRFTLNFLSNNQLNKSYDTKYLGHMTKKKQINYIMINNKIYSIIGKYIPLKLKFIIKNLIKYFDFFLLFILMSLSLKKRIQFLPKDKDLIQKFYYHDNKKIEKLLGINLKKWGYY